MSHLLLISFPFYPCAYLKKKKRPWAWLGEIPSTDTAFAQMELYTCSHLESGDFSLCIPNILMINSINIPYIQCDQGDGFSYQFELYMKKAFSGSLSQCNHSPL